MSEFHLDPWFDSEHEKEERRRFTDADAILRALQRQSNFAGNSSFTPTRGPKDFRPLHQGPSVNIYLRECRDPMPLSEMTEDWACTAERHQLPLNVYAQGCDFGVSYSDRTPSLAHSSRAHSWDALPAPSSSSPRLLNAPSPSSRTSYPSLYSPPVETSYYAPPSSCGTSYAPPEDWGDKLAAAAVMLVKGAIVVAIGLVGIVALLLGGAWVLGSIAGALARF